jgi:hypothetical protein
MKQLHLIVFVCVAALGITTARAQQVHHVLRFEITKGGTLIASPELLLQSGMVGRIHLDSRDAPTAPVVSGLRENIALTPTVQGENISIAFEITSDTKKFRPSLVISRDLKGSFEWISTEGQAIRLTVSWAQ